MATDLSVIVVSYNTRDLLAKCLRSVYAMEAAGQLEVLVVDNGSSDGSAEMVSGAFASARLISNERNLGFAAANNQALHIASGRLMLLLNSDAIILPDAWTQLTRPFHAWSRLGVAGLCLLNPDNSLQPSWGAFPTPATELSFQTYLFKIWPSRFPYGRRVHPSQRLAYRKFQWVDWVTGAALVIRRDLYECIGGLPVNGEMYGEDLEYCWRAREAGYTVAYCPGARAYHYLQGSAGGDFARWIENYTRAMLAFYDLHCSAADLRQAARYIQMGSMIRQRLWWIVGRVAPQRGNEARSRIIGYGRAAMLAARVLHARDNGSAGLS